MRLGTASVTIQADGLSKYDSDLKRAEKRTDKFGKQSSKSVGLASSAIKKLGLIAGSTLGAAVLGKLLKDSIVSFKAFETATVDMGKVTSRELGLIRKDILGLSSTLGTSTDLMKGYYQVISAGVTEPTKALDLLTTAAKASKAAHVNQADTIRGLTKVMAGFEGQVKSASDAADLLFSIEKAGQTSVAELIPVIGGLAKITSELGAGTDDLATSLAILTQTTGTTAEAATQYQALLIGLYKPTVELSTAFENLGFASGKAMIQEVGFIDTLKQLKGYAKDAGIGISELLGRKEAMLAMSALSVEGFNKFNDVLKDTSDRTGSAKRAYEEWSNTTQAKIDAVVGDLEKLKFKFVETFGTKLHSLLEGTSKSIQFVTDDFQLLTSSLKTLANIVAVNGILYAGLYALPIILSTMHTAWLAVNLQASIFMLTMRTAPGVLGLAATSFEALNTALWGTAASLKSVSTYFGIVAAAFTGWQVGTWLYDNFETARLAGLAFVDAIMKGWIHIEYGAKVAWAAVSHAFTKAINLMKKLYTAFLDTVAGSLDLVPGMGGIADSIKKYSSTIKDSIKPNKKLAEVLKELNAEKALNLDLHDVTIDSLIDETVAKNTLEKTNKELLKSTEDLNSSSKDVQTDYKDFEKVVTNENDIIKVSTEDTFDSMSDSAETTFNSMADFYKDALLQMVDGTGSFVDMIKSKLKNLAASVASSVLTSVTGSVLKSIPGVSGMAGMIPGLGGQDITAGLGLKTLSGIKGMFSGGLNTPGFTAQNLGVPVTAGMDKLGFSMDSQMYAANAMNNPAFGMMLGGAGALAGGYGMYSAYKSGSPMSGALSGAGTAAGIGAFGAAAAGTSAGSAMGLGALSAAGGPIGLIVGAIIGGVTGYFGKLSAASKLHRVHRGERYMGLLERMSFGTEEDPFDINAYSGIEDFLGTKYGEQGIGGRFAGSKDIYAVQKYMGVGGTNMSSVLKTTGEALDDYRQTVNKYTGSSIDAVSASQKMSKAIDDMAKNTRGLNEQGEATVMMFQKLKENAIALQLKDLASAFQQGEMSFSTYVAEFERLDLGEQAENTLKYNEALKLLTDDTLPALSGQLSYARDVMREARIEMDNMANAEQDLAVKTTILNSSMELSEAELAFIRDESTKVNTELLNLYATMGLLDTEFQLFTQDSQAAAFSSEWFADQAEELRNKLSELEGLLEKTGDLLERLKVEFDSKEIMKAVDAMYQFAGVLDTIGMAVGGLEDISDSLKGIAESESWAEMDGHIIGLIDGVNTLAIAFETLGMIKFAALLGWFSSILIVLKMAADVAVGVWDFFKNLFGGDQTASTNTVEEWLNAMNPVTMNDFAAGLAPREEQSLKQQKDALKKHFERLEKFAIAEEKKNPFDTILPKGWKDQLWENYYADLEALEESYREKLRQEITSEYELKIKGIEKVKSAFENVYDSVSGQLNRMMTSSDNPADIFERMEIQYKRIFDPETGLKALAGSTTGLEQAGYQSDLSTALGDYLSLAQEAYQRPSTEYQRIFEMVTSELRSIQDSAQDQVSIAEAEIISLNKQMELDLQNINTAIDDTSSDITGALGNLTGAVNNIDSGSGTDTDTPSTGGQVFNINVTVNDNDIVDLKRGTPIADAIVDGIKYAIENGPLREPIKQLANGS